MSRRIILTFHGLGSPPDRIDAAERPYWVPGPIFESIVSRTAGRADVDYTFDDGNRTDLEVAAPVLQRFGRTGLFFVLTGRLGDPHYLSPADVLALHQMGMVIGLHGRDHVDWRKAARPQLIEETVAARQVLADITGRSVDHVSIPFGAYDRRVIRHLRACGFATIHTTDGGPSSERTRLRNRTSIRSDMDEAAIEAILAGRSSLPQQLRRTASMFVRRHVI